MVPYITHGGRSEQRIGKSMQRHIGITVPQKAKLIRYLHAAYHQPPVLGKPVHIKPAARSYIRYHIHQRLPSSSLSPSMSKVRVNRSVWSRGDDCAVAII